jgi:hypothetical protein
MADKKIIDDDEEEVEEKKLPKITTKPVKIIEEETESDKDKFLDEDEFEDGDIADD